MSGMASKTMKEKLAKQITYSRLRMAVAQAIGDKESWAHHNGVVVGIIAAADVVYGEQCARDIVTMVAEEERQNGAEAALLPNAGQAG